MGAGPLLTVSGGRGCACLPRQGATMRVRPPAHPLVVTAAGDRHWEEGRLTVPTMPC